MDLYSKEEVEELLNMNSWKLFSFDRRMRKSKEEYEKTRASLIEYAKVEYPMLMKDFKGIKNADDLLRFLIAMMNKKEYFDTLLGREVVRFWEKDEE